MTATYDPRTGQLATLTDPSGMRFRYHYDRQARLDTLVRRNGRSDAIRESRAYDLAARVARRRVWTPTATLLADTLGYDLQGRATAIGTNSGRDTVAYDALGWVSASTLAGQSSTFTLDALQNRASARLGQPHGPAIDTLRYEAGTARLLRESGAVPGGGDSTFDTDDSFGNLHEALQYQPCLANWPGGPATGWVCFRHQSTNDYDESNRMIAHQLVYDTLAQAYEQRQPVYTASETYRYDPFGRRVWYRSIKGATCYDVPSERAGGCHSTLTRVIWDGPQILGEIRADGSASAPASSLESDAPSSRAPITGRSPTCTASASTRPWSSSRTTRTQVRRLEQLVVRRLGFEHVLPVTGQTYSRKLDAQVLGVVSGTAASAAKFSADVRMLQSFGEIEEPFESEQIGSSAMAYKRNPMRSERIASLARFVISIEENANHTHSVQFFERTLDDSANRRLVIPESFLATDARL